MLTLQTALRMYGRQVTPTKRGAKQEHYRIDVLCRDEDLARRHLAAIRPHDLARWRDQLVATGLSPSSIRHYVSLISQVYKTAASEWGCYGLHNPARGMRLPKDRPGRDRRLEGDEEQRLFAAAAVGKRPWLVPAITWAVETGMRQGEQLSLRRSDIQGHMALLRMTKNGKPRHVPVSSRALAALAHPALPEVGLLWPYTRKQFGSAFKQVCRKARVEGLVWHDLRHEAISRLFERGLTTEEVMSISGHRTYTHLFRYTHLRPSSVLSKLG